MSCVGFFTPEQLARVRAAADDPRPVSAFTAPEASTSKRRRVADMATSSDASVRAAAASSSLASPDVLGLLAGDVEPAVRCAVARNPAAPPQVLDQLAADAHETVRGWVAANPAADHALVDRLVADPSPTVRSVAAWARRW